MNRKERLSSCRLYGIADMGYTAEHQLISVTEKLLAGGLGILQLRAKNHDPEHIARMGSRLAPLCREYGCLFIINDYPEIALGTGADGVHLGQDDGELAPVRAMLGANAIIGRSTHSPEQALGAFRERRTTSDSAPCFPRAPSREGRRSAWKTLQACGGNCRKSFPSSASEALMETRCPPFWRREQAGSSSFPGCLHTRI